MDDYIKRSDAIHALCKAVHKDDVDGIIPCENQTASCLWSGTRVCDYAREIDALPSADVPQWIPVTDRYPEPNTMVLASYDGDDIDWCFYDGNAEGYVFDAWMPLPEPYKDGEQND